MSTPFGVWSSLVAWGHRHQLLGQHVTPGSRGGHKHWSFSGLETPAQIATVVLIFGLGWALAANLGRAAGPTKRTGGWPAS